MLRFLRKSAVLTTRNFFIGNYNHKFGANLGIILEKCYLNIYQLLNA